MTHAPLLTQAAQIRMSNAGHATRVAMSRSEGFKVNGGREAKRS